VRKVTLQRRAHRSFNSIIDRGRIRKMLTAAMKRIACAMFAIAAIATPAHAGTYEIETSKDQITAGYDNMGYWSPTLAVTDSNQSYMAGRPQIGSTTHNVRNYFTFSLASIDFSTERLVSAALQFRRYGYPGNTNDALERMVFSDVTTPYQRLNTREGVDQDIFRDLGTGTQYGAVEILKAETGVYTVWLNEAALADITAKAGSYFSVGGECTTCQAGEVLFNGSGPDGIQRLMLVTAPIPEPAEWSMIVAGLLVIGFIARRRNRAASLGA
jgi:hypothetical protein